MRVFVYIGAALWISVGIVIFFWNLIVTTQMWNNLVPKPGQRQLLRPQAVFLTDPAEFTELGQRYRQKAIRVQLLWLVYLLTLFIVIVIAMSR